MEPDTRLALAVVNWWLENRFRCVVDGEGEERNLFDEAPDFVKMAYEVLGLEGHPDA